MRKTKIICTVGPKTETKEQIQKLIEAGSNALRLNTSHLTVQKCVDLIRTINEVRVDKGLPLSIIVDLAGSKIRTGSLSSEQIEMKRGATVTLTSEPVVGSESILHINYSKLANRVKPGQKILLDDGKVELKVTKVQNKGIKCDVISGGSITAQRGVNIPNVDIDLPLLTDEDMEFIKACSKESVDYFCFSFVRNAESIVEARKVISSFGDFGLIAKIETAQALNDLERICEVSDGVLVARGDLGVETALEEVPILQKRITAMARDHAVPVIIATQMLESMLENPTPTRAEIADIANAIFDGADALLLTSETAIGNYPVKSVEIMSKTAQEAEKWFEDLRHDKPKLENIATKDIPQAIAKSCWDLSKCIGAKAIITSTASGGTARRISRFRPSVAIIATTPEEKTFHRLSIVWGVTPIVIPQVNTTDVMIHVAAERAKASGFVRTGDVVIVTSGVPCGVVGTTNMIKVHEVE